MVRGKNGRLSESSSLAVKDRAGKYDVSLLVPRPLWAPRRSQPVKAVSSDMQSVKHVNDVCQADRTRLVASFKTSLPVQKGWCLKAGNLCKGDVARHHCAACFRVRRPWRSFGSEGQAQKGCVATSGADCLTANSSAGRHEVCSWPGSGIHKKSMA